MATSLKYLEDSEQYEWTGTVFRLDKSADDSDIVVVVDETVFYPRGGGQPEDQGWIVYEDTKQHVKDVRFVDGDVLHIGPMISGSFTIGNRVKLLVDPNLRKNHARLHTGGHLVMTAVDRLWGFPAIKGYHFPNGPYIQAQGSIAPEIRESAMADVQRVLDELVKENSEVTARLETVENLKAQGVYIPLDLPTNKPTRVVVTSGYQSPCGGTHVKRLGELQGLYIAALKSKQGKIHVSYGFK